MEYIPIRTQNRQKVNTFITEHWFSTKMIIRGEIVDMTKVNGIVAMDADKIIGLLTYVINNGTIEFEIIFTTKG